MNELDVQDALKNALETIAEANEEVEGDDDDATLADYARDLVDDFQTVERVATFEEICMLTQNAGLVIRTANGDEFQITILQSKIGRG